MIKQQDGNHPGHEDAELRKRNARFDQELADSRDHDKQSGKGADPKKPAAPAGKKPGKA
ncbi:MAG TPA: hypothetical protein VIM06_12025 [Rhodanobacter sp.]